MRIIPVSASVALFLALPGCGGAAPAGDGGAADVTLAPDSSTLADAAPSAGGGITAIDAALNDGRAMPEDTRAPSAYDRELAAAGAERRSASADADKSETGATPQLDGSADDLLDTDDNVTTGG